MSPGSSLEPLSKTSFHKATRRSQENRSLSCHTSLSPNSIAQSMIFFLPAHCHFLLVFCPCILKWSTYRPWTGINHYINVPYPTVSASNAPPSASHLINSYSPFRTQYQHQTLCEGVSNCDFIA